jgi:hypothetical protein
LRVGLGRLTAEAQRTQRKEFFLKKYSELCELGVSAVNMLFLIERPTAAPFAEKTP